MLKHTLNRSRMPLGALVTAAALAAGASSAAASDVTVDNVDTAVATETATVTVAQTRADTETATAHLTRTVRATATARAKATRQATRKVTVTVTRAADSPSGAHAEAEQAARATARLQATRAATSAAGSAAARAAHVSAARKARSSANRLAHHGFATTVLRHAAALKGRPYRLGADGPRAFDCSGYVRYVLRAAGVSGLPRTSAAMSRALTHVRKSSRQIGDLILFGSRRHGVTHVGIYAGHGTIWHAPGTGRRVTRAPIWTSHYAVARTV
ncbi:C40 family peptidase [Spongisporangium articulatum]|uniref:C40 family peptidase n=1 Tax=Spongisporangium articulatum TaxID=3362603 RepID=A0ABW8ATU8_9ACTN